MCVNCLVMSDSLQIHGLQPTRFLYPWGFSRQEYWSGLQFPSPGDLPNPGIEPQSLTSPALAGRFFTTSATLWPQARLHWRPKKKKLYLKKQSLINLITLKLKYMFMKMYHKESQKINSRLGKHTCNIYNRQNFGVLNTETISYKSVKKNKKFSG